MADWTLGRKQKEKKYRKKKEIKSPVGRVEQSQCEHGVDGEGKTNKGKREGERKKEDPPVLSLGSTQAQAVVERQKKREREGEKGCDCDCSQNEAQ